MLEGGETTRRLASSLYTLNPKQPSRYEGRWENDEKTGLFTVTLKVESIFAFKSRTKSGRILYEKSFNWKSSGDEVYCAAWSLLVIVKDSCSQLRCQRVLNWNCFTLWFFQSPSSGTGTSWSFSNICSWTAGLGVLEYFGFTRGRNLDFLLSILQDLNGCIFVHSMLFLS